MKQLRIADCGLRRLSMALAAMVMIIVLAGAAAGTGYIDNYTLLNAKTATGAGTALDLNNPTYSEFTCVVTWGGTAPTNTVIDLEGSLDGTTFDELATSTVTATGTMFHVADKPVRYIRGEYVSKAAGDATTAVTLKCSAVSR